MKAALSQKYRLATFLAIVVQVAALAALSIATAQGADATYPDVEAWANDDLNTQIRFESDLQASKTSLQMAATLHVEAGHVRQLTAEFMRLVKMHPEVRPLVVELLVLEDETTTFPLSHPRWLTSRQSLTGEVGKFAGNLARAKDPHRLSKRHVVSQIRPFEQDPQVIRALNEYGAATADARARVQELYP